MVGKRLCVSLHTLWIPQDIINTENSDDSHWVLKIRKPISPQALPLPAKRELEILKVLRDTNPNHRGHRHVSFLRRTFMHQESNKEPVLCFIFEPMHTSLEDFRKRRPGQRFQTELVRRFTTQILQALEYAHGCGVIHCGKWSNKYLGIVHDD